MFFLWCVYSVSKFDLVYDVFRLLCFMYFTFWNIVFVCLQCDIGKCYVCNVWVSGYFCMFERNFSFFCELYQVCFLVVSI